MVTAITTCWRLGDIFALQWAATDLDGGTVTLWPAATDRRSKRKRPKVAALNPIAVEHLRQLWPHKPEVFGWPDDGPLGGRVGKQSTDDLAKWRKGQRWAIWSAFREIQQATGIAPHEFYCLDDLRLSGAMLCYAGALDGLGTTTSCPG